MIYTHVLSRGAMGVRSPADGLPVKSAKVPRDAPWIQFGGPNEKTGNTKTITKLRDLVPDMVLARARAAV